MIPLSHPGFLDAEEITRFVAVPAPDVSQQAIRAVSEATGIPGDVLTSQDRSAPVARARHAAMAICRDRGMTVAAIGRAFNRDHTSVLHGLRRVQQWKEAQE